MDENRQLILNPYIQVVNKDGHIYVGWSRTRQVQLDDVPQTNLLIETLRDQSPSLAQLKAGSQGESVLIEQSIQALWAAGLLRYADEFPLGILDSRYERQAGWFTLLPQVQGEELRSHDKIRKSTVTVLGVGGLGSHVAWNLAACGVGQLNLVDGDVVEASNLNRQFSYTPADVGRPKVTILAERLSAFNPDVAIRPYHRFLNSSEDVKNIVDGSSFVVRALDTPMEIGVWVNEACVSLGIPFISGGFLEHMGVLGPTTIPGQTGCLACNLPAKLPKIVRGINPSFGPLVTTIAGLMASEVITYIADLGPVVTAGRAFSLVLPGIQMGSQEFRVNPACPVCRSAGSQSTTPFRSPRADAQG